jgi:hypothetical protein
MMSPTLGAVSLVRSPCAVTCRHSNTEGKTPAEPDNDPRTHPQLSKTRSAAPVYGLIDQPPTTLWIADPRAMIVALNLYPCFSILFLYLPPRQSRLI